MTLPDRQRWQQLSPLLDELLDLSAAGRLARLADLQLKEPALAAELKAMLSAAGQASWAGFLGHGGAGRVWRARRADGLWPALPDD